MAEYLLAGTNEADITDGYYSARTGPKPIVRSFPTLTAELDHAAQLIGTWSSADGVQAETVALPVRDEATRDRVVSGLGERGIDVRSLDSGTVKPGFPVVLTVHRAKGTEVTRVAVRAEQRLDAGGSEGLRLRRRAQRGEAAGAVAALRRCVPCPRRTGGHLQRHRVVPAPDVGVACADPRQRPGAQRSVGVIVAVRDGEFVPRHGANLRL